MAEEIRYAHIYINEDGLISDRGIVWKTGTEEDACDLVRRQGGCVLFFPADVPGKGCPVEKDVSRHDFEEFPNIYGVYYYNWNGRYIYE